MVSLVCALKLYASDIAESIIMCSSTLFTHAFYSYCVEHFTVYLFRRDINVITTYLFFSTRAGTHEVMRNICGFFEKKRLCYVWSEFGLGIWYALKILCSFVFYLQLNLHVCIASHPVQWAVHVLPECSKFNWTLRLEQLRSTVAVDLMITFVNIELLVIKLS